MSYPPYSIEERFSMIGDISSAGAIYIVCGYTDMRKSILGLCSVIKEKLET